MKKSMLIAAAMGLALGSAHAGGLPVYKCKYQGHTEYTQEPCLSGTVVDTTPTRGIDKSTGTIRKGADVQRQEFQEGFANMVKPATGMTPEQLEQYGRRIKLAPKDREECSRLDQQMPEAESQDQGTTPAGKAQAD
ncbi:MAG: DUF4124 domain-containing protein, partial [Proteobacteria bacterium]|nr:DUF4124 domain-containing protein [Pseudomonadota bacterium]